jgi:hypothetical protein
MGDRRRAHMVLVGRYLRVTDHLKDIGLGGRVILKWIFKKWGWEACTDLAQRRDSWRAVVHAVLNIRIP